MPLNNLGADVTEASCAGATERLTALNRTDGMPSVRQIRGKPLGTLERTIIRCRKVTGYYPVTQGKSVRRYYVKFRTNL
jgi:hypothetical protein